MNIGNIIMVIITKECLYIIEVPVLHTVFKATQIVHHPACVANSVENYSTLEEKVYVKKENITDTTRRITQLNNLNSLLTIMYRQFLIHPSLIRCANQDPFSM